MCVSINTDTVAELTHSFQIYKSVRIPAECRYTGRSEGLRESP